MQILALTLALALAPPREGSSVPPYRIMDVLKPICIDTKAEPQAVLKAATTAGYQLDPDNDVQANLVSEKGSIAVFAGVSHLPENLVSGSDATDLCVIILVPTKGQEADVFAWLGIGGPRPVLPWSYLLVDGPTGPRPIGMNDRKTESDALAAGTLRTLRFEPLSPDGLHVVYGAVHKPTKP